MNAAQSSEAKQIATLGARLAIRGRELHEIRKGEGRFFEVRHQGQARTCTTAHDVEGLLAQIESAAGVAT